MSSDELDNAAYYEARADEHVWRAARALGVSRRRFIELAALGSAGALTLLGACTSKKSSSESKSKGQTPTTKAPIETALVKDIPPSQFKYSTELGINAEMNW